MRTVNWGVKHFSTTTKAPLIFMCSLIKRVHSLRTNVQSNWKWCSPHTIVSFEISSTAANWQIYKWILFSIRTYRMFGRSRNDTLRSKGWRFLYLEKVQWRWYHQLSATILQRRKCEMWRHGATTPSAPFASTGTKRSRCWTQFWWAQRSHDCYHVHLSLLYATLSHRKRVEMVWRAIINWKNIWKDLLVSFSICVWASVCVWIVLKRILSRQQLKKINSEPVRTQDVIS